jgi:hypothetical protein
VFAGTKLHLHTRREMQTKLVQRIEEKGPIEKLAVGGRIMVKSIFKE